VRSSGACSGNIARPSCIRDLEPGKGKKDDQED